MKYLILLLIILFLIIKSCSNEAQKSSVKENRFNEFSILEKNGQVSNWLTDENLVKFQDAYIAESDKSRTSIMAQIPEGKMAYETEAEYKKRASKPVNLPAEIKSDIHQLRYGYIVPSLINYDTEKEILKIESASAFYSTRPEEIDMFLPSLVKGKYYFNTISTPCSPGWETYTCSSYSIYLKLNNSENLKFIKKTKNGDFYIEKTEYMSLADARSIDVKESKLVMICTVGPDFYFSPRLNYYPNGKKTHGGDYFFSCAPEKAILISPKANTIIKEYKFKS